MTDSTSPQADPGAPYWIGCLQFLLDSYQAGTLDSDALSKELCDLAGELESWLEERGA